MGPENCNDPTLHIVDTRPPRSGWGPGLFRVPPRARPPVVGRGVLARFGGRLTETGHQTEDSEAAPSRGPSLLAVVTVVALALGWHLLASIGGRHARDGVDAEELLRVGGRRVGFLLENDDLLIVTPPVTPHADATAPRRRQPRDEDEGASP